MERHDAYYRQYVQILREELRPATGCTEPIAIAYAAAKARSVLGALPDRVLVEVSGNIIKNVKSVVVPHTGGLRGIPAAAAAGIVAGDAEAQLEVLSGMTEAQSAAISPFLKVVPVEVRHADTPYIFDIQVTVFHGPDSAQVRLVGHHTNVVSVRRGGQVLLEREISEGSGSLTDRSCLTVEGIVAFADCLSTEDVEEVLEQQIRCNMAIAEEGLRHDYGANIGKTLLRGHEEDLSYRMRAYAAAASDARMNGGEMPGGTNPRVPRRKGLFSPRFAATTIVFSEIPGIVLQRRSNSASEASILPMIRTSYTRCVMCSAPCSS